MTTEIPITFNLGTTAAHVPLGVEVRFDNTSVFKTDHLKETTVVSFSCSDDDGEHVLEIELTGKLPEHTKITESGEIVQDALISIDQLTIDDIDIDLIFSTLAEYTHDFNGSGETVTERCYNRLGCNGVVRFKFTTPVYLWLLENM
jgi:hypothetical protein